MNLTFVGLKLPILKMDKIFGFTIIHDMSDLFFLRHKWKETFQCDISNVEYQTLNANLLEIQLEFKINEKMLWLRNQTHFTPMVSVTDSPNDELDGGLLKIWIRPEDFVYFVLKFMD